MLTFDSISDFRKWFRIVPRSYKTAPRIGGAAAHRGNNIFFVGGHKSVPLQLDYLTVGDFDDFEQSDFDELRVTSKEYWESNAMKKHPEVLELKEKLRCLSKAPSFGKNINASRTEVASSVGSNQVLQLIFDWISQDPSYKKVLNTLEEETQQKCKIFHFFRFFQLLIG